MLSSMNDRMAQAADDSDDTGDIIGIVVDNEDPEGLGRIKVRVPNLFDPDQGELPWIGPTKKSPFGIGSDYGVYGSPAIDSEVVIHLQNNDPHYGLAKYDLYSKKNANAKFKSPKTWGFKDPSGNELFVDMDAEAWEFTHSSGLTLKYDVDGNLKLHVPGDKATDVAGNQTDDITGDLTETVGGNYAQTVTGTLNITVTGNATVHTDGNLTASAGGSVSISGGGVVNITGSQINLN